MGLVAADEATDQDAGCRGKSREARLEYGRCKDWEQACADVLNLRQEQVCADILSPDM